MTSRVLVLGAGGFLGQHVRRELDSRGLKTVGVSRSAGAAVDQVIDLAGATQHELDQLISAIDPDAVVNCAGGTHGSVADLNRGNVVAVHALLSSLAWSAPTARLVHLGSAAEYGGCPHGASMAEDFDPRPGGAYGYTKLAGTTMVLRAREQGFDAVVLRAFNVSGPGSPLSTLLGRTRSQLLAGEGVRLGPLDTWRDFVDVRDVARAVALALETGGLPPVLNIGRGEAVLARDVVARLVAASGVPAEVVEEPAEHAGHAGSPAATVAWQQADLTTVTRHLDWSPSIDLDTSVHDTWTG